MKISIKHMVCPRCVDTVRRIATEEGLDPVAVALGELTLSSQPSTQQIEQLRKELEKHGFSILESDKSRLINRIKSLIIERIHYDYGQPSLKLSAYLSQELSYNYSHLSKLFSSVEAMTIERYATLQRIERAKELLSYREQSIAEVAELLDYSSPAHLSTQFRQETGMTPSQFRKLNAPNRRPLDSI